MEYLSISRTFQCSSLRIPVKFCGLDVSWFTEFIHETTNDYYEWYIWERLLRVETGRPGEEPIKVKELKKGENKGHKIVSVSYTHLRAHET